MKNTLDQHIAKSQFYRWLNFYEEELSEIRIKYHMQMIAKNIVVKSATGTNVGKEEYLSSINKNRKTTYKVRRIKIGSINSNEISLEADVDYMGIKPNGENEFFQIQYFIKLKKGKRLLPLITEIEIDSTELLQKSIEIAYSTNRIKSLLYYWFALMESLEGKINPFNDLLAEHFILNYGTSSRITTLGQLENWIIDMKELLSWSNHHPEILGIKRISKNEFQLSMELKWEGLSKNGRQLKARTKNTWFIMDNSSYKFPKILRMNVEQIDSLY